MYMPTPNFTLTPTGFKRMRVKPAQEEIIMCEHGEMSLLYIGNLWLGLFSIIQAALYFESRYACSGEEMPRRKKREPGSKDSVH